MARLMINGSLILSTFKGFFQNLSPKVPSSGSRSTIPKYFDDYNAIKKSK